MIRGRRRGLLGAAGVVLLIISTVSFAESVTPDMATQVAHTHITRTQNEWNVILHESPTVNATRQLTDLSTNEILGYVVNLEPQGFVLIPANTALTPVLAYSYRSNFSHDETGDNILLHMVREDLEARYEALGRMTTTGFAKDNISKWKTYLEDKSHMQPVEYWPPTGSTTTGGWVTTTWVQTHPYNIFCPKDPNGSRSITGCVATSMAQIVNYHSDRRDFLPQVTFGTADRYVSDRTSPTINIDGDADLRDFPNFNTLNFYLVDLSDHYFDDISLSATNIGALNFACGVSVEMAYSSSASGALAVDVPAALRNKFGYPSATFVSSRAEGFYTILKDNMKDSLPALLSIQHPEYGHAVVCDGLKESEGADDKYHLNFGWGNLNPTAIKSCWYELPDGMPEGFNVVDGGAVNISPPEVSYQPDNLLSLEETSGYIGNDVYDVNSTKQTLVTEIEQGATVTYYLKVQNDGNQPNTIAVNADQAAASGWSIKYYDHENSQIITTAIKSESGWSTSELNSGEEKLIRIEMESPDGEGSSIMIEFSSTSSVREEYKDVVAVITYSGIEETPDEYPGTFITAENRLGSRDVLITYGIARTADAVISVYDAGGRKIRTLVSERLIDGVGSVSWDRRNEEGVLVSAGPYFIILETGYNTARNKTIVLQ